MSNSRIPSPARSLGAPVTPRRYKSRTRSVGSPARSTTSGRLSALIQFKENNKNSFVLSPAPSRRSVLNDDTEIEEPRRRSWWKKIADNSRDAMEALNDNKILETDEAVEEFIDIELLSQQKKSYSIDIPESSDSESISSIVIPQRKLFTQKDQGQKIFGKLIETRETLAKLHKSHVADKTVNVAPKNLFGQGTKPRTKPVFPAALLNLSPNKTANKTKENAAVEVKGQVRTLFGNRPGTKRKNMFADFIVSESEDEISEIQPRVFEFPKKADTRRDSGNSRGKREHSPTSSVTTDIEMDDWKMLPSSTMVENQLEDMMAVKTPAKRPRLSNLADIMETETKSTAEEIEKEPSDEEQELRYADDDKSEQSEQNQEQPIQDQHEFEEVENEDTDEQNNIQLQRSRSKLINEKEMAVEKTTRHQEAIQNENRKGLRNISKGKVQNLSQNKILNVSKQKTNESQQKVVSSKDAMEIQLPQEQNIKNKSQVSNEESQHSQKEISNEIEDHNENELAQNEQVKNVNNTKEKMFDAIQDDNVGELDNHEEMEVVNDTSNKQNPDELEANVEQIQNKSKTKEICNSKVGDNQEKNHSTQDKEKSEDKSQNEIKAAVANEDEENEEELQEQDEQAQEESEIQNENEIDEQESEIKDQEESDNDDQNESEEEIQNESEVNEQDIDEEEHDKAIADQEESDFEHENSRMEVENENELQDHEENVDEAHNESKGEQQNESATEARNESAAEMKESKQVIEEYEVHQSKQKESDNDETQNEEDKVHNDCEVEMQEKSAKELDENEAAVLNESKEDEIENEEQNESAEVQEEMEDDEQNESADVQEEVEDDEQNESVDMEEEMENDSQNESAEVQDEIEDDDQNESAEMQEEMEDDDQNKSAEFQDEKEDDDRNESAEEIEDGDQNESSEMDDDDQNDNTEAQEETENVQNESQEAQEASEDEIEDSNDQQESANEQELRNKTHDTTGRYRKKNETDVNSPEAILHDKTNQLESFTAKGRNTSVRKTTMLKNLNIRPSLSPPRESTGLSDGTRNSSAEGSGWDSHRTTRKTLRQTFGRDFTPRKSLRALVMEKSAKRQTAVNELTSVTAKFPQANSTELPEASMAPDDIENTVESNLNVSKRTRQTTLEMYLQKIKKQNMERKIKMEEAVLNSLKAPTMDVLNPFKVPAKPMFSTRKLNKQASKPKTKQTKSTLIPLEDLPAEVIEDMKYKPPKRFQPSNASWITKRLYKFLESKLESKYDYKARVRAEKLVETIYYFAKDLRRVDVAQTAAVDALKHEMARLNVVKTHFDFYQFFHEYMPREIRVKVVPDVVNKINVPRHGVFSDIIRGNTVQG